LTKTLLDTDLQSKHSQAVQLGYMKVQQQQQQQQQQ